MSDGSKADEIRRYSFLVMFANDDIIDADELRFLEKLTLADSAVDDDERAALRIIFARVDERKLDAAVRGEIARFRAEYDI